MSVSKITESTIEKAALARVIRVFRDKLGGLVMDYLGLAHDLVQALATYTENGGNGKTAIDQKEAVAQMLKSYEVCLGLMRGFDGSGGYRRRRLRVSTCSPPPWSGRRSFRRSGQQHDNIFIV